MTSPTDPARNERRHGTVAPGGYRVRVAEPALTLTGERTLPGIDSENYWFRRHEAAYAYLQQRLSGPTLLEVGAGEGYGAAMLSERFVRTVALDYDAAAITHLQRSYPALFGCRANLAALPIRSGRVDAVVSLQVLEHVWLPEQFLLECRRVLRPNGQLVLSTPNRLTFSPGLGRGGKPQNPFHVREFDPDELLELLARTGFAVTELLGLRAGERLSASGHDRLVTAQLGSAPATWSPTLAAEVAAVGAADFVVSDQHISTSLDLLALARAT